MKEIKFRGIQNDGYFAVELERLLSDKYGLEVSYDTILIILDEIKQRIKSACEFYLRYKDYPELLIREQEALLRKLNKFSEAEAFIELIQQFDEENSLRQQKQYNEWLFKLAFKDVLKGR